MFSGVFFNEVITKGKLIVNVVEIAPSTPYETSENKYLNDQIIPGV